MHFFCNNESINNYKAFAAGISFTPRHGLGEPRGEIRLIMPGKINPQLYLENCQTICQKICSAKRQNICSGISSNGIAYINYLIIWEPLTKLRELKTICVQNEVVILPDKR